MLSPGRQVENEQSRGNNSKGHRLALEKQVSPARVGKERHVKNGAKNVKRVKTDSRKECNEQLGPAKCIAKRSDEKVVVERR